MELARLIERERERERGKLKRERVENCSHLD
jgi:hypothetical protein